MGLGFGGLGLWFSLFFGKTNLTPNFRVWGGFRIWGLGLGVLSPKNMFGGYISLYRVWDLGFWV